MLTDCFVKTAYGKSRSEDYVIADSRGITLCDGCSSAPNTDVGAPILAHCVHETNSMDEALLKAKLIVNQLGLPLESLLCTVLTIRNSTVFVWGDGYLYIHDALYKIESMDNMPNYPAYKLLGLSVDDTVTVTNCMSGTSWTKSTPFMYRSVYGPMGVFSDGLGSFEKADTDLLAELVDFKSYTEGFCKRRCKRVLKDMDGFDDFSMGWMTYE
jgi:hypothetical protein